MYEQSSMTGGFFNNISKKLIVTAKLILVVGVLSGIILGIVQFASASDAVEKYYPIGEAISSFYTHLGLICIIGLPVFSIILSFQLYGIGVACEIKQNKMLQSNSVQSYQDSVISVLNNNYSVEASKTGICDLCEKYSDQLTNVKIVDEMGTSYRSFCPHCLEDYQHSLNDVLESPNTYCLKCGFKLSRDAVFCPKCGTKKES